MQALYDALCVACDNYQAMQRAHLHCLTTDTPYDMADLVFERERLFADLQNRLTAIVYQWQADRPRSSLTYVLQTRLAALLESDVALAEHLHASRAILEQQLLQIQQGKKALMRYRGPVASHVPWYVDRSG